MLKDITAKNAHVIRSTHTYIRQDHEGEDFLYVGFRAFSRGAEDSWISNFKRYVRACGVKNQASTTQCLL